MAPVLPAKLLHAPRSPFAIKVRIAIHELGLSDAIELVAVDPWTDESLRSRNPLCKVPTLILANGGAIYDSRVICEYLDGGAAKIIPPIAPARWEALRRQAIGDGLAEALIRRFVERLGPANERSDKVARRQEAAIASALDALETEAPSLAQEPTIGEIAIAAALVYLGFRSPELVWRQGRPALARWFDVIAERPSIIATRIVTAPNP